MMQSSQLDSSRQTWEITGLPSDGPFPGLEEKLSLFGQFVGDWDIVESKTLNENGRWIFETGELHWRWILEGRAVQDVWMFHDDETSKTVPAGTTVRFYDPEIDAWHSVWLTPLRHEVLSFIGRKVGSEIVLERKAPDGILMKWIFSDIKPNSFSWRGEKSRDLGETWTVYERMTIRRKGTS
jgi:hypothetical protein